MALPLNKIGDFSFVELNGEVQGVAEEVETYARAGVNGIQAVFTGQRGKKHTLLSTVDVANRSAARTLYADYRNLIGQAATAIVSHDLDIAAADAAKCLVLDVRLRLNRNALRKVGGLTAGTSAAWLQCEWDVILLANAHTA